MGYVFWAGGGQGRPCATVLRDLVGPSILSKSHQNRDRSEIVSRPRATSARPQPHRGIRQRGRSWGSCAERLVGARGAHALIVGYEETGLPVKRCVSLERITALSHDTCMYLSPASHSPDRWNTQGPEPHTRYIITKYTGNMQS